MEEKTIWSNMSLSANQSTTLKTYDASKSGYTLLGAIGYDFGGSYSNCLSFSKLAITSPSTFYFIIANNGNDNASGITVKVQFLYSKN